MAKDREAMKRYRRTGTTKTASDTSASKTTQDEISGDVSFEQIISASRNKLDFSKSITLFSEQDNGNTVVSSVNAKKDLQKLIDENNINDAVMTVYRDKAGANDLQRMQDLGFTIQAKYKGEQTNSARPAQDRYYMKRTGSPKPQEAQPSRQRTAAKKRDTSVSRDNEGTTREQRRLARANKAQARAARKVRPLGSR